MTNFATSINNGQKMQKNFQSPLIFVAMTIIMAAQPANAEEAADAWSQGQQAFQQQDYLLALSHFETARNAGQTGPAVHYNIGVCQYKLQNYSAARQTFALIGSQYAKMRPLTEYNLGLVALKQSQRESARRHFRESYQLSNDNHKLRILASTMLRRTQPVIVDSPRWLRTVSLRAGYDDNVSLQDEIGLPVGISAESPFAELSLSFRGPFGRKNGFRLDGGAYLVSYFDIDDFDQSAVRLGALYDWRNAGWGIQLGAHGGTTILGGDGFDRSATLSVRASKKLTSSSSVAIRFRYDDIAAVETIFDGIDGSRQRLDLRYRWYLDARSVNLTYVAESNDRIDPSVSPRRNKVRFAYQYTPTAGWGFEIGAELRSSEYDDLVPIRDEDLTKLNLGISRSMGSDWLLLAQYTYANNDASDPTFSYSRNQFSVGALKIF